jgi:ubiquinone/menaquinone biosynthesis C-methylase UbiE
MNDDSRVLAQTYRYENTDQVSEDSPQVDVLSAPAIPDYLQDTYWWAYLHPKSFWFFEREWVVNLILWGNMRKLTNAVVDEMKPRPHSDVLQVACVYGDFSNRLASHLKKTHSRLNVVDVASIQLRNLEAKLRGQDNVSVHHQDSTKLLFKDESFAETVVFFLLHEQPVEARRKTIKEAIRVTKPGGRVIFVDYHRPRRFNPMRYIMKPILILLEPFALDLWRQDMLAFMPAEINPKQLSTEFYFGGLYQKIVLNL